MMVVILTPVDGIIRWLPRGFSCSQLQQLSLQAPCLFPSTLQFCLRLFQLCCHVLPVAVSRATASRNGNASARNARTSSSSRSRSVTTSRSTASSPSSVATLASAPSRSWSACAISASACSRAASGVGVGLFHGRLPQQSQLAGQQLRKLWRQCRELLRALFTPAGAERTHHRGDMRQGAAAEVRPHLLVGRVCGAGGDKGCGGVFNAADGVRGERGHVHGGSGQ